MEEAIAFYDDPSSVFAKVRIAYIYGSGGDTDEALRLIEEVEQEVGPSDFMHLAAAYASVGRFDEAFEMLDASYENRDPMLLGIRLADNRWYPLHEDPRHAALLERMNFPP